MKHKGALIATMTVVSCFLVAGITLAEEAQKVSATTSVAKPRLHEAYGKLPLSFEANQGQLDSRVKFLSRGRGYSLFLTPTGAVLALRKGEGERGRDNSPLTRRAERVQPTKLIDTAVLRMHLLGANPEPKIAGREELPGKAHYFVGNDPTKWRTNVPTYARVYYEAIYPGIDLVYYGNQRQLEYDFVVSPGADPKAISLAFEGMDGATIDGLGDLVLRADGSEVRLRKPVVYQEHDGQRAVIPTRYVLKAERQVTFEVAAYDAAKPLIIDPVLVYSTYLGGSEEDDGFGIAVDAAGNAYVTGSTQSSDFPKMGAFQPMFRGGSFATPSDAFVTKLDTTGAVLLYSTYLGGTAQDIGYGIAVDADGSAYVTGVTGSTNFPTLGAFQRTFRGNFDAFVTKLDPTGAFLLYSTYLGGADFDEGFGIAVDASGNAYVTGLTVSTNFPKTLGAYQPTFGGGFGNAFVTKLDTTKTGPDSLVYSTYLGGAIFDQGFGIAVDSTGNAYVTGETQSMNFPKTDGAFQPLFGGGISDAFVTKLDTTKSGADALIYSTFLGGSGDEGSPDGLPGSSGIAVDAAGNAYVTGRTSSSDFPTTEGAFQPAFGGGDDAFVTKLNQTGSALVYSTYVGGSGDDSGAAIAVDASGNAYAIGSTQSSDFPTTRGALQPQFGGFVDAFVTKLDPTGAALLYSTYLGGSEFDSIRGTAIAQDEAGNAYVTGFTDSSNSLPTTVGTFQAASGGGFDAFVAKLRLFNTLEGENVTVTLGQVTVTFASVTAAGDTTLTTSTTGPLPPGGFKAGDPRSYYNLATTASFSSIVTVCIHYNTITSNTVASLKLFQFEDPNWVDATVSLDTATQIICGHVTRLSLFAILEPTAVAGPAELLAALITRVNQINLPRGVKRELIHELEEVLRDLNKGKKLAKVCKDVDDFVYEVRERKTQKHLGAAESAELLDRANAIKAALGCPTLAGRMRLDRDPHEDKLSLRGSFVLPAGSSIDPPRQGVIVALSDGAPIVTINILGGIPEGEGWTTLPGPKWVFRDKKDRSLGDPMAREKLTIKCDAQGQCDLSLNVKRTELMDPHAGPISTSVRIGSQTVLMNTQMWRSTEGGRRLVTP